MVSHGSGESGKKAGVTAAAQMLSGLDKDNRERVLELIGKKDPSMAELLKSNLLRIDDLSLMTVSMLQDFIKKIRIQDLALALKLAKPETQEFFMQNLSRSVAGEIKDILDGPKVSRQVAMDSHEEILGVARKMMDEGTLILKSDNDEYV